jgi:glucose-1-phosphatase
MQLPVLIFDFGNVVAYFDYSKFFDRVAARRGCSGEEIQRQAMQERFALLHTRFETGELTPVAFYDELGLEYPFEDFVRDWEDVFWLNEPVARLIARLKSRSYRLILGSNTNCLHAAYFRRKFAETLDLFDALVLSYQVGAMKPDRRFYEACERAAGVPAGECVFIDDLAGNVDGARRAGLKALQYVGNERLEEALGRLGVEVGGLER